jgi:hypothetical protein
MPRAMPMLKMSMIVMVVRASVVGWLSGPQAPPCILQSSQLTIRLGG